MPRGIATVTVLFHLVALRSSYGIEPSSGLRFLHAFVPSGVDT